MPHGAQLSNGKAQLQDDYKGKLWQVQKTAVYAYFFKIRISMNFLKTPLI